MLMVSSMNLFSKCPSCQDTGCFGWHSFSFELIFAKDSKERHILKCQGAQHGQPFDIMTKCCHLESSRSRTRQLRLKKTNSCFKSVYKFVLGCMYSISQLCAG